MWELSCRALSHSAAKRWFPAARPAPGADRGDVVEVTPEPFELEQERASAGDLCCWPQAVDLLCGARVGDAVGDGTGAARSRGVIDCVAEWLADGGALEAAVLVEESDVQVQNAIAHHVQPEVA